MAKRIVKKYGKKTLDVIEKDIERLGEVVGIGEKRIGMIGKAWDEQREIREVMLFFRPTVSAQVTLPRFSNNTAVVLSRW